MKPILALTSLASLLLFGCGSNSGFESKPIDVVSKGDFVFPPDLTEPDKEKLGCEAPLAQYFLNTEMIAFEIQNRNKVKFGFDIVNKWINGFEASIDVSSGRLDLDMDIRSTLQPKVEITAAPGSAKMSRSEFSFTLGIKLLAELGFEHYSETPLAVLTSRGLNKALKGIRKGMNDLSEEWSSHVRYINHQDLNSRVGIPVGTTSGIKVGDEFAFYNLTHRWTGKPCESDYFGKERTTAEPLATGSVVEINDFAAIIDLERSSRGKGRVQLGAQAVVHKLTDEGRKLRQPLLIEKTEGGLMEMHDGSQVDLTPYFERQIGTLAAKHGFIVYTK